MAKLTAEQLDKQLADMGEAPIPVTFTEVAAPDGSIQLAPKVALEPMVDSLGAAPRVTALLPELKRGISREETMRFLGIRVSSVGALADDPKVEVLQDQVASLPPVAREGLPASVSDDRDGTTKNANAPTLLAAPAPTEPLLITALDGPRLHYLGGPAGSGKTFAVKLAAEADPRIVLCSTTGISACNLGEQVTTINSLLMYYDLESLQERWTTGFLERRLSMLHATGCRRIVLDEVSMMDGRQLTIILEALKIVNEVNDSAPLKLTLTGDYLQLPPIDAGPVHVQRKTGRKTGGGCFAFEIPGWQEFETTLLSNIRRQADPRFIAALREARRGNGTGAASILGDRCVPSLDENFNGTTLMARNSSVDKFNMTQMLKLEGPELMFKAALWGDPKPEWKNIPMELGLRKGALIMILANCSKKNLGIDEPGYEYVNGDLGIFLEQGLRGASAQVKLHRTGEVISVFPVTRQNLQPVSNDRLKWLRANTPDKIKDNYEVKGALTYMPLRAAWASTVHKAQGLSLDNVQVDLHDGFMHTPGMAYVALTRCRTLEGLRIVGNPGLLKARCQVDPRVRRWL